MKKKTVLLVDDEAIIRKSLGEELQAEGYAVSTSENGEKAITELKQGRFDLVITDLRMEGLDGIGVLKQTKKIAPSLPIMILTGYGDVASAIDALRLGADDYMLKPCELDELLIRMSRCFEKQDLLNQIQKAHAELEQRVEERTAELQETNVALKVLLQKREQDRQKLEEQMLANVKQLVEPFILKLKKSCLNARQENYLQIIESTISEIVAPFARSVTSEFMELTPSEIKVANLVKQGKSTKEIAELLNVSYGTISSHRRNIRKKLGISCKKINLQTILASQKES